MDNEKKQETDLAYQVILGVFCALILFWLIVKLAVLEKAKTEAREAKKLLGPVHYYRRERPEGTIKVQIQMEPSEETRKHLESIRRELERAQKQAEEAAKEAQMEVDLALYEYRLSNMSYPELQALVRRQKVLAVLEDGLWHSGQEIEARADVANAHTAVSELGANGYNVDCKCLRRGVCIYRLKTDE